MPAVIAAANQRGHQRADRMASAYLAKVGIDAGLLGLTKTIKFEDIHVLTRDEIARFGLDRRELVETPWKFESDKLNFDAQDRALCRSRAKSPSGYYNGASPVSIPTALCWIFSGR